MTPVPAPERQVALYEALIATHPEVERKGKSSPYTSINGNMFTILSADGGSACVWEPPTGKPLWRPSAHACMKRTAPS
jgi:hypothetical protein